MWVNHAKALTKSIHLCNHIYCPAFNLELFLTAWIQRFFIQQLSVVSVSAHLTLGLGFFRPSKALQQGGIQSAHVPMERLWNRQIKNVVRG